MVSIFYQSEKTAIVGSTKHSESPLPLYTADDLNEAAEEGIRKADNLIQFEQQLQVKGLTVKKGSTAHLHSLMLRSGAQLKNQVIDAQRVLQASKQLQKR